MQTHQRETQLCQGSTRLIHTLDLMASLSLLGADMVETMLMIGLLLIPRWATILQVNIHSQFLLAAEVSIAWGTGIPGSELSLPQRWTSVDELSRFARGIDANRPIDTFSEIEIGNMKLAASFLEALLFEDESSYLYTLLIKRYRAEDKQQAAYAAIISCTSNAKSKPQRQIAKSLLRGELQNKSSLLTHFLFIMALAQIHVRRSRYSKAVSFLKTGRRLCQENDLLQHLPHNSRAFDFATFLEVARCKRLPSGTFGLKDAENAFCVEFNSGDIASDIVKPYLERVPGPFEIANGKMGNDCIRACLRWCKNVLRSTTSLRGIWKNMNRSSPCISEAETIATFTFFWDRSQNHNPALMDSDLTIWITETEPRMGISNALLLIIICQMSKKTENYKRATSSSALIRNIQRRFQLLLDLSDTELATMLLKQHMRRNMFGPWSSEENALQKVARAHVLDMLRKSIMVVLPDLDRTRDLTDGGTTTRIFASILPTLAPAFDSLSLRRMRDRMHGSFASLSLSRVQRSDRNDDPSQPAEFKSYRITLLIFGSGKEFLSAESGGIY